MPIRRISVISDSESKNPARKSILKNLSIPVTEWSDNFKRLCRDMVDTMYANNGVGLAANQVRDSRRVIVLDIDSIYEAMAQVYEGSLPKKEKAQAALVLVNPEIFWRSKDTWIAEEGCLSVPDVQCNIERSISISVRYDDFFVLAHREIACSWLLARVIQHEVDHLSGKLITDYPDPSISSVQASL